MSDFFQTRMGKKFFEGDVPRIANALESIAESLKSTGTKPVPRVVVFLDGGLVEEVISDTPCSVLIIDKDVDGADDDSLMEMPDLHHGDTLSAYVSEIEVAPDTEGYLARVFSKWHESE